MKANIKNASISDLNRDFSLSLNETFLSKPLNNALLVQAGLNSKYSSSQKIGDMNLQDLSEYIAAIAF